MSAAAIVGAAQVVQRPGDRPLDEALGPIELMAEAARQAAADAGARALLSKVGWIGVAGGWFRYRNPAQLVGQHLGIPDVATALSPVSGTSPQDMVALATDRVIRGELEVALVLGGEARWSHQRISRSGGVPTWDSSEGVGEPETLKGFAPEMLAEMHRLGAPATAYALMEDSLRVAHGRTIDEQRDVAARLWAGFSDVATGNPYAWDRSVHSVESVRDATPENRMISFPYTKAMVANNTVDMTSALLICHPDVALTAGVSRDRMVFPQVVTSSHETWQVLHRNELCETPALATAGRAAFEITGLDVDQMAYIDLYACFPAVVQMSAASLGCGDGRTLTVTGGLGFAGGGVGNSTGQSIAAMVPLVRAGGYGLVHGNGGNATKHSFAIYANQPPDTFVNKDCQNEVDHRERSGIAEGWSGPVEVEAATVVFDREGPSHVFAAVRDSAGARAWATSQDRELMEETMKVGLAGTQGELTAEGELR